jgi:alpha-tubulin suppressor-like RCC1 family protein/uncharacterized protein YjdB
MIRPRSIAALALSLALACGSPPEPREREVREIRVEPDTLAVVVDSLVKLEARALDPRGREIPDAKFHFASLDPDVARVDSRGWVEGRGPGGTEIVVRAGDREARVPVRVRRPVHRVEILPEEPKLLEGEKLLLVARPLDIDGHPVEAELSARWSSEDPLVVKVSATGELLGIAPGSARVQVVVGEGKGEARVAVEPRADEVRIRAVRDELIVGENLLLQALVYDRRGDRLEDRPIDWSSSDPTVALVESTGRVFAKAPGEATIRAEVDGAVGSLLLRVVPRVHAIQIVPELTDLYATGSTTWTALASDEEGNRLDRTIFWFSSDPQVATVGNQDGRIVGVSAGVATITARADDAEASAVIHVHPEPRAQVLPPLSDREEPGFSLALAYEFVADDPLPVQWSSSDPQVARPADEEGMVDVVGLGKATITLSSGGIHLHFPVAGSLRFRALAVGDDFACGITERDRIWCWGANDFGQLGSGGPGEPTHVPVRAQLDPSLVPVAITAGSHHACALLDDGRAFCWGDDRSGELGAETEASFSATPLPTVLAERFVSLSAGRRPSVAPQGNEGAHTCGLTVDGRLLCWGNGRLGQMGNGTTPSVSPPVEPSGGLAFTQVATGAGFTCGLADDSGIYCWGEGPLGTPPHVFDWTMQKSTTPRLALYGPPQAPEDFPTPPDAFAFVAAGWKHACGITTDGEAYCWGVSPGGALGTSGYQKPFDTVLFGPICDSVPICDRQTALRWATLSLGSTSSCGLDEAGRLLCWGRDFGELAPDAVCSKPTRLHPVELPTASEVLAFEVSKGPCEDFACILDASGIVRCHGFNLAGQAGQPPSLRVRQPTPLFPDAAPFP